MRMADLQPGWAVVTNDGHRLGSVREVGQNYVRTAVAGGDLYVPASVIANVANGVVHLNVTGSDARNMGWAQPPRGDDSPESLANDDLHRHV